MQLTQSNPSTFNSSVSKLKVLWAGLFTFLAYVKSFKWIVDIARWIQDTGAVVAESAFTLAILYVIIHTFGYSLIGWIPNIDATVNPLIMIVFTILPELVMLPIMLTTADHWNMAKRTGTKQSYTWFIAYALLTTLFVVLTLILLSNLSHGIQVPDAHAALTQADGNIFILRCFSGLLYTVLQRLWDNKGKKSYTAHFDKLTSDIAKLRVSLLESDMQLSEATVSLSEKSATVALLQQELTELRVTFARHRMARKSDTDGSKSATQSAMQSATDSSKSDTVLPIDFVEKRNKLKEHMQNAILTGQKVNLKKIASDAGVSYGMARKHGNALMQEISEELPSSL